MLGKGKGKKWGFEGKGIISKGKGTKWRCDGKGRDGYGKCSDG